MPGHEELTDVTEVVLSIDKSGLGLDSKDLGVVAQEWSTDPKVVMAQKVNLSSNSLGLKLDGGFSIILELFSKAIELDLSENNLLYHGNIDLLSQVFTTSLSKELMLLNVSNNDLNAATTGEKFSLIFKGCSDSLRTLDLSNNNLSLMTGAELRKGLAKLPHMLSRINLSNNHFEFMEPGAFSKAMSGFNPRVTSIDLSNNGLDDNKVRSLFPRLRGSNIVDLKIDDNPEVSPEVNEELQSILKENEQPSLKQSRLRSHSFGGFRIWRKKTTPETPCPVSSSSSQRSP